jgi:hypothetical protein
MMDGQFHEHHEHHRNFSAADRLETCPYGSQWVRRGGSVTLPHDTRHGLSGYSTGLMLRKKGN